MRPNRLRRMWRRGDVAFGSLINLRDPAIVEILALAGLDFVVVDCEHSTTSWETVEDMARAADAVDVTCLVRIPDLDPKTILRVLETGVHGIWVPQVESAGEARAAAEAVRYARRGRRGIHGGVRASRYGTIPFGTHLRASNREILLTALIETRAGVEAVDAILAVPGLDAITLGPGDLAASLGVPGAVTHPSVRRAVRRVLAAARGAGVPVVLPAMRGAGDVPALVRAGAAAILHPLSDALALGSAVRTAVAAGRRVAPRRRPRAR